MSKNVEQLDRVVIRIAGDSGDGMQLTGDRFTQETAMFGNDLSTFPNFPAEIRAPAGTLAGVSSFQLHFADHDILTPGDRPDVLVAMNPAALKANLARRAQGRDADRRHPRLHRPRAGPHRLDAQPARGRHARRATTCTPSTSPSSPSTRSRISSCRARTPAASKNMFALGLLSLDVLAPDRGRRSTSSRQKFANKPDIADGEHHRVQGGLELRRDDRGVRGLATRSSRPRCRSGTYRNITGNLALAYGLIAASRRSGLPLFLGAYPITPASDILHELSKHKRFGVRTFQAEDEIAGIGAALGAAFGGALAVTTSSGPGIALKGETIGLAVSLELPLIICDIQRGGPSTGLPTKTEQSDLLQAMYGRNGEAPVPIVAAAVAGRLLRRRASRRRGSR